MSGIAGVYHVDGRPVEPSLLRRMTEAVRWRGPDGIRQRVEGNLGMAHLALQTTPESRFERQPLVSADGQLWLTAHARIDNRRELIGALQQYLNSETTVTDADLILAAYRRWGTACPQQLLGDFAFALWDADARRLFAVRDHMGVRPFYYSWNGHTFAWGTEVKQLLRLPWVPRDLNERSIGLFLCAQPSIPDETFYEQVHQLPPASCLVLEDRQLTVRKYWALDPHRVLKLPSDDDYAEAFRELLYQAVEARLRRIAPVGIALSGGLDSSAVACVAADILGPEETQHSLRAYTIVSDKIPEIDEREYAQAVVEKWAIPWTQINADKLAPLRPLPLRAVAVDEDSPLGGFYEAWHGEISHQISTIQQGGIQMDGHPGDNLAGLTVIGYDDLFRQGRWWTLWRRIRRHREVLGHPFRSLFWGTVIKPLVPYTWRRFVRNVFEDPLAGEPWIQEDFARRIGLRDLVRSLEVSPRRISDSRRLRYRHLSSPFLGQEAGDTERFNSRHGLEMRRPWVDRRLVELVMSLPVEQTFREGQSKFILRNALEQPLPSEVRYRLGKSYPSAWWYGKMRRESVPIALNLETNMVSASHGFVDERQFQTFWQRFQETGRHYERDTIWYVFCLERWLQRHATAEFPSM